MDILKQERKNEAQPPIKAPPPTIGMNKPRGQISVSNTVPQAPERTESDARGVEESIPNLIPPDAERTESDARAEEGLMDLFSDSGEFELPDNEWSFPCSAVFPCNPKDESLMRKRHAAFTLSWPAQRQKVADAIDNATKTINLMNVDPGKFLVDTGAQVPLIGKPALDTLIEYRKARGLPLPIWIHDQKAYTSGIGGKCLLLGEVMMPLGFAQINGKCVMKVADENVPPIIPMPMLRDLGATIHQFQCQHDHLEGSPPFGRRRLSTSSLSYCRDAVAAHPRRRFRF